MDVIVKGRGWGKTSALLLKLAQDKNAVLLCASHERTLHLRHQYPVLAPQIFSALSAKDNLLGRRAKVYVDDLADTLYQLLGHTVAGVAIDVGDGDCQA